MIHADSPDRRPTIANHRLAQLIWDNLVAHQLAHQDREQVVRALIGLSNAEEADRLRDLANVGGHP